MQSKRNSRSRRVFAQPRKNGYLSLTTDTKIYRVTSLQKVCILYISNYKKVLPTHVRSIIIQYE